VNDGTVRAATRLPAHASLFNSSITRVRPLFCRLLSRDPSGVTWLPALLNAAPNGNRLRPSVRNQPGTIDRKLVKRRNVSVPALGAVVSLEHCFEHAVPPPTAFLRWLLENPDRLSWPRAINGKPRKYGTRTQAWRAAFLAGDADYEERLALQRQALDALDMHGGKGSRRKYWAFEGFTEVDCFLATERLVLAIEGKRKEPLSRSTDWYPRRSQLVRNLEAVRELAQERSAAVLLVTENPVEGALSEEILEASLPHISDKADRSAIGRGYLGQMTWQRLCDLVGVPYPAGLPATKLEALDELKTDGRIVESL
jgi:hypothetical protein